MANKKLCHFCDFKINDYHYGFVTLCGEVKAENSAECQIRNLGNYCELEFNGGSYNEGTISINYCPWCGRKL